MLGICTLGGVMGVGCTCVATTEPRTLEINRADEAACGQLCLRRHVWENVASLRSNSAARSDYERLPLWQEEQQMLFYA